MKKLNLPLIMTTLLLSSMASAVHVNPKGHGEVLIYPYYTVNNDLNTLYSVVNASNKGKALVVRFREGKRGRSVLEFNLYLSAFDVWVGALVSNPSSISGHQGEDAVLHISADASCAPFLNKSGQEFLPWQIDLDAPDDNMKRSTEGYLEIIEMGVLAGPAAEWVNHGAEGIPNSCISFVQDWEDGDWDSGDFNNPSGGLSGSASLVNVAEGVAMTYDAIPLDDFWNGPGIHASPGAEEITLNNAFPKSQVLNNGQFFESSWDSGIEAVSALFTSSEIYNEYALDSFIAGKSEWVVTFPTKYSNSQDSTVQPYLAEWDGTNACENVGVTAWDREQSNIQYGECTDVCPTEFELKLCHSTNTIEFLLPQNNMGIATKILGSSNQIQFSGNGAPDIEPFAVQPPNGNENGWAQLFFSNENVMFPVSGTAYQGLPAVGFLATQFTNSGAQPGLLAQYGSIFEHKSKILTN